MDERGRLLFSTDAIRAGNSEIIAIENGETTVLFEVPGRVGTLLVDNDQDLIYTGGIDGVIRVYSADGEVVNESFADQLGGFPVMDLGPGGPWGKNLYVANRSEGTLYRLDAEGNKEVVVAGLSNNSSIADIAFGPDNALYLSENARNASNDRILRIAPNRETLGLDPSEHPVTITVADGKGGVAVQNYVVNVLAEEGNHDPVIVSEPEISVSLPTNQQQSNFRPSELFIASSRTQEIRVYNSETLEFIESFSHPLFSDDPPLGTRGVAFNDRGNLVASTHDYFVEFSDYGVEYARYKKEVAEFNENIIFDRFGNLYTTTFTGGTSKLNQYRASDYTFVQTINLPPGAGALTGITLDNQDRLYVASQKDNIIYVLQANKDYTDFDLVDSFDASVTREEDFRLGPEGIQINQNGELLVAGGDIYRLDSDTGEVITGVDAPNNQLPVPLSVDRRGRIYTADFENGIGSVGADIIRFSPDGSEYLTIKDNDLLGPFGLAISGVSLPGTYFSPYQYDVDAIDPDDDTLTYSLVEKPEGMEINPETGEISWFPSPLENQIITDTLGDEDFFGFGSGNIGQPVPEIEFNNQEPDDLSFTDLDARFDKRFRPEGNNDFEWSHDLSEPLVGLTLSRATLEIAIGGIEDGGNRFGTGGLDNRLFIEGIEVTNAFDDLDQNTTGTDLINFELSDEQLASFTADGILDVSIQGGFETDSGQQFNESYFIDFARLSVETNNTSTDVTVRVEDDRGGADEQEFTIQFVDAPDIDLTIDEVTPSNLAVNGQTLTLTGSASAEITNQGSNDLTQPFDVLFFEDTNTNQTYDQDIDTVLGSTTITAPLAAGASQTVTADLAGNVSFLGVPIWAFIDSGNTVIETDETNNLAFSSKDCITEVVGEFDPVVEWNKREFTVEPSFNQVMMTPVVIDVNDDAIPDVIFSTFRDGNYFDSGKLRAISGADGSELWTVTNPAYEVEPGAELAVGDIDNDTKPEIIAISESGIPIAFEHDGTFKWQSNPGNGGGNAPALADLNQDGTPEIVVGFLAFDSQGNLLWRGDEVGGVGNGRGYSVVADLDLDDNLEVVAGNSAYRSDGSLLWNSTSEDGFSAVGNFDDDPNGYDLN